MAFGKKYEENDEDEYTVPYAVRSMTTLAMGGKKQMNSILNDMAARGYSLVTHTCGSSTMNSFIHYMTFKKNGHV